jgi:hypothetical protein
MLTKNDFGNNLLNIFSMLLVHLLLYSASASSCLGLSVIPTAMLNLRFSHEATSTSKLSFKVSSNESDESVISYDHSTAKASNVHSIKNGKHHRYVLSGIILQSSNIDFINSILNLISVNF